ncbi:MAG TPA: trimethylamine methyltransferase family protein, partial [Thermoleophilia bacterium]
MARPRLSYLTDADKEFVHEQTLRVLAEVGVCYGTPTLTGLLAAAGATVDAEALRAKLPWELIESCLKLLPRDVFLAG